MSGRSAIVRKQNNTIKTKPLDKASSKIDPSSNGSISEGGFVASTSSGLSQSSDDGNKARLAQIALEGHGSYGLAAKAVKPIINNSHIEKSAIREAIEGRSEVLRNGMRGLFTGGKKKKANKQGSETRPTTSQTMVAGDSSYELETTVPLPPPYGQQLQHLHSPPQTKLPPVPVSSGYKQWGARDAKGPLPWSKKCLMRDPELWDEQGDVAVYIRQEFPTGDKVEILSPSYQVRSDVIENSGMTYLRQSMHPSQHRRPFGPPSPGSSQNQYSPRAKHLVPGMYNNTPQTPPMSEDREFEDSQCTFDMYLMLPPHMKDKSPAEMTQTNVKTRNALAIICNASLVGVDFAKALIEVQEHLEGWYDREGFSATSLIMRWLENKGLDDPRNNPPGAIALLNWAESPATRCVPIYTECFVHLAGMYNHLDRYPDFQTTVSRRSREMLDRGNFDMQERISKAEERLRTLDFADMWKLPNETSYPASRTAFERLREFFIAEFSKAHGVWPPPIASGEDNWLTRTLAKSLQSNFGCLYDLFVDKEVEWDCVEERPGPKWGLIREGKPFEGNSVDLHLTDMLRKWDTIQGFEHIPHPFPLVPASIPIRNPSKDNLFKASKRLAPKDERLAMRKFALAYSESTNNVTSELAPAAGTAFAEAFLEFEKADQAMQVDPRDARRGRWVLVYGILQTLAEVAVDIPMIKYNSSDITYHLSASLKGTPPWGKNDKIVNNASHELSYCWKAAKRWEDEKTQQDLKAGDKTFPSRTASIAESTSAYSEMEYRTDLQPRRPMDYPAPLLSPRSPQRGLRNPAIQGVRDSGSLSDRDFYSSPTGYSTTASSSTGSIYGYGPGIQRIDSWPMRVEEATQLMDNDLARGPLRAEPRSVSRNEEIRINNSRLHSRSPIAEDPELTAAAAAVVTRRSPDPSTRLPLQGTTTATTSSAPSPEFRQRDYERERERERQGIERQTSGEAARIGSGMSQTFDEGGFADFDVNDKSQFGKFV